MMSAGKGATAANGEQYYYQRDPMIPDEKQNGQWVGSGAQALGLDGSVQKEDFPLSCGDRIPGQASSWLRLKTVPALRIGGPTTTTPFQRLNRRLSPMRPE